MQKGSIFDSVTNVVYLMMVLALIAFTAMKIVPVEVFTVTLGAGTAFFYNKKIQEDEKQKIYKKQESEQPVAASPVDHADDTMNLG